MLAQRSLKLHNRPACNQASTCEVPRDDAVLKTPHAACTGVRWRTYSSDPPQRLHAGSQKRHSPSWISEGTRSVWTLYGSPLLLLPCRRHLASIQL